MKIEIIDAFEDMKASKVIKDYALGGGIAVEYYVNPPATKDIDFFIIVESKAINFMQPIYDYFISRGGKWTNQHIKYKGEILDLLPAWGIGKEAVENADKAIVDDVIVKIIKPDYLAAILHFAGRKKDFDRIELLIKKNLLTQKFAQLIRKYS